MSAPPPRTSSALPGADIVLLAPECAATLAHLIACHVDPANPVRAMPRLHAQPNRPAVARVAVTIGLQDLLISADTAQLAVKILDLDQAPAGSAQHDAVAQVRRATSDARRLAARADAGDLGKLP